MSNAEPPPTSFAPPTLAEAMGLLPLSLRARQAMLAIAGGEQLPKSHYDRSSLALLRPRLGIPLWRGRFVVPRTALLTNLFNHRQTPTANGWSVKRTQVEDFRGLGATYDSHNGTDLCIPVGSLVCAPAAGVVARVWSEFNRGGLKIAIDHGDGLTTSSAHLARSLVKVGQPLRTGEPFAVSGYSGLDGFITFPWGIPHIHFNVWLDGRPVDPFARQRLAEVPIWMGGFPRPPKQANGGSIRSVFSRSAVDKAIAGCLHEPTRQALSSVSDLWERGQCLVAERNYYPTRFADWVEVYAEPHERREMLALPFDPRHIDCAMFADQLS
jgi:murein DD-endopeptidase